MSAPPPTADSVLTVAGAVRALPMRDADARAWLLERGLILNVEDRKFVIWGRVLDELARAAPTRAPARRRPSARCDVVAGGGDCTDMGVRWPRPITVGDVRATPMKGRGRQDGGRVYWRARRSIGGKQVAISLVPHLPSKSGWATRAEAEAAIVQAIYTGQRAPTHAPRQSYIAGPDPALTVEQLLAEYIEHREVLGGLRGSTLKKYRAHAKAISAVIGDAPVRDLTTPVVERFIRRQVAEKNGSVVRQRIAVLRPALTWAIRTERTTLASVPMFPDVIYEPERTSHPPPLPVLRSALAWLRMHRPAVHHAMRLQALLGARAGEMWNLRWSDIIERDGTTLVRLDGKTQERVLPATAEIVALLNDLRSMVPVEPSAKVLGPIAAKTQSNYTSHVSRAFKAVPWAKIGGEQFKPHDLRSLFCNALIRSKVSLPVYQALTGHSAAVAAKHYWAAQEDEMQAAMKASDVASALAVTVIPIGKKGRA